MNERQAIEFIMQEIKEQRRADFQFYLEMRNQSTATYERFLDRLRELDEREAVEPEYEPHRGLIIPPVLREELIKGYKKDLPLPKSPDETPVDLNAERADSGYTDSTDVTTSIEKYLKHINRAVGLPDIQRHIQKEYNREWSNFSSVMRKAIDLSPHINVNKITPRKYLYSYREV